MRRAISTSLSRSGLLLGVMFSTLRGQAQMLGNLTERQAACSTYSLPASLTKWLDTSFLGERQFVSVGTANISFFSFGPAEEPSSGTALLMIAGQGATASVWTPPLLSGLSQGRRVVIYDQIGIGDSTDAEPPAGSYSVPDYAAAAAGLIQALDLGQPDVLGWSLGGFTALTLAVQYPGLLHRLVLAETAPGGPGLNLTPYVAEIHAQAAAYGAKGVPIPGGFVFPDTPAGNAALCRVAALRAGMPADSATTAQVLKQTGVYDAYGTDAGDAEWYDLGNITAPTLVLAGSQDTVLPVIEQQALFEHIPGASMIQFADAGHGAILQHSVTAAAIISAFLDDDAAQA